jgi:hypothetical protein
MSAATVAAPRRPSQDSHTSPHTYEPRGAIVDNMVAIQSDLRDRVRDVLTGDVRPSQCDRRVAAFAQP